MGQVGRIAVLCWLVGLSVGIPVYLAGLEGGVALRALPVIVVVASVVVVPFACVGALFASILLLMLERKSVGRRAATAAGIVSGALGGVFHPLTVLWLAAAGIEAEGAFAFGGLQMLAAVAIAGAVSGGLVTSRRGSTLGGAAA